MFKVGDKVGLWRKNECECGKEYYISRTFEKVVTERDLHCHNCNDAFDLDLIKNDLERSKNLIKSLIDVAEELNYRLSKTDQSQGFLHHIDVAKDFLEDK